MKRLINAITYILILLALHSCNSDVFIEDIRPSESSIDMDGNGDSFTVHFKSSDWQIISGGCSFTEALFKIYNAEGVNTGQYGAPSLDGLGRVELSEEEIGLTIERKHPKELTINVDESIVSPRFGLSLLVGNEYESHVIEVIITQCDRYVFDDITYSLDAYSYSNSTSKNAPSVLVKNGASEPIKTSLFPFRDECREVEFFSYSQGGFNLLQESKLEVDIPTIVGRYLEMDGARALYTHVKQELPLAFANEEKVVTIPAHTTQRITPLLLYDWFETDFKIRAHHPKTNKQRTITGQLRSNMPREYFIGRETIKE